MSLKLFSDGDKTVLEFENVVSLWTVLRETVDTPYLKSFVVDHYDGGNTLVPISEWEHESIMYRVPEDGVFLFPYESLGFVLDDSIVSVNVYAVESYSDGDDYRKKAVGEFRVKNTDEISVVFFKKQSTARVISYYLLSLMKAGYTVDSVKMLESVLKPLINSKLKEIEYLEGSLHIGLKGLTFAVKFTSEGDKVSFYRFFLDKRAKKKSIKEKDVKNLAYLKKKWVDGKRWKSLLIAFLLWVFPLFLVIALPKIFSSLGKTTVLKYVVLYYFLTLGFKFAQHLYRKIYLKLPHPRDAKKEQASEDL